MWAGDVLCTVLFSCSLVYLIFSILFCRSADVGYGDDHIDCDGGDGGYADYSGDDDNHDGDGDGDCCA